MVVKWPQEPSGLAWMLVSFMEQRGEGEAIKLKQTNKQKNPGSCCKYFLVLTRLGRGLGDGYDNFFFPASIHSGAGSGFLWKLNKGIFHLKPSGLGGTVPGERLLCIF